MPELRDPRRRPDAARGRARRRERLRPPEEGPLIPRKTKPPAVLILGIGNPGRRDDGLGAAAAERLRERRLRGVTCDANYQLNLEDVLACAEHEIVVFIDAARGLRKPFAFTPVRPSGSFPSLSHSLSPEALLAITTKLYDRTPEAHLLAIRGHSWTIGEGLSAQAETNLALALEFLNGFLKRVRR